ncbi:hypothetical protein [Nocardioides sp. SR21]|uniref:hypothetical protein n=1 Tax=Nocardioides sp. SR21 TaxID=2919501 RepID=UPI001FAA1624|nr:hypothetical protein [Nocardioides sp. SR21]
MDNSIILRDFARSELEYRSRRIQSDLAGRRKRRALTRGTDIDGLTWTKVR